MRNITLSVPRLAYSLSCERLDPNVIRIEWHVQRISGLIPQVLQFRSVRDSCWMTRCETSASSRCVAQEWCNRSDFALHTAWPRIDSSGFLTIVARWGQAHCLPAATGRINLTCDNEPVPV
jgi:hypothetical protein